MKKILFYLLIFFFVLSLFSCNSSRYDEDTIYAMDTFISAKIYGNNRKELNEILKIYQDFGPLFDNYHAHNVNNIYTINNSLDYVEVDDILIDAIKKTLYNSEYLNRLFDIRIGKITKMYKEVIESNADLPSFNILSNESLNIYNSSIDIDENKIKINGDIELDLGGIAKGYVSKLALDYLKEKEITNYLINAGSSTLVLGEKPNGDSFKVKIDNKDVVLNLKNTAVSTSSIFKQYVIIDGQTYHHIISPISYKPENTYDSLTVVGEDPFICDLLSTALFSASVSQLSTYENLFHVKVLAFNGENVLYDGGLL